VLAEVVHLGHARVHRRDHVHALGVTILLVVHGPRVELLAACVHGPDVAAESRFVAQRPQDDAGVVALLGDQALDAQLAVFAADTSIQPLAGAAETFPCPNCDDGRLRRLKGKNGFFWGCSNYQREPNPCQTTLPDDHGKPGKRVEKSQDHPCPACGEGYLQRRPGKKKNTFWWGCDRYPACTHSAPDDNGKPGMWGERPPAGSDGTKTKAASGRKKGSASGDKATPGKNSKALDKTYPCTACGKGWLQARSGSRGVFWGCSNYPACTHSENDAHGVPQNHVKKHPETNWQQKH